MVVGEAVLLVGNFALYVVLSRLSRWLAYLQVFLLFIFAFIVSNREFSVFYLLLFIVAMAVSELNPKLNTENQSGQFKARKFTSKGFKATTIMLTLGTVMYITIAVISNQVGGQIIGTPNLAITSTQEIATMFKPTFEATLGVIENFFIFTVFDLLLVYGVLIPVVGALVQMTSFAIPMLTSALLMGILHVAAYSVSVGLILWASLAFAMFIISRFFLQDSLAADTAHYLNNGVVSLGRAGLKLVGI